MFAQQPTLELLFQQLGLDASIEAMDQFIATHQLTMDIPLHKAPFWTRVQHDFIISNWKEDDDWAIVIDELNQHLHFDSRRPS